ncbi:unnamed protein product [Meloidogyne enterolobii]|uniref:Uncharacterized protein n=1 Tax=Meloidogyne enterolobii TaxID=390850 RepID=A0ACB1AXH9_MELEN
MIVQLWMQLFVLWRGNVMVLIMNETELIEMSKYGVKKKFKIFRFFINFGAYVN